MLSALTKPCAGCTKHITPPRVIGFALPLAITVFVIGILGLLSYLVIPPTIAFVAVVLGMGLTLLTLMAIMAIWRQALP